MVLSQPNVLAGIIVGGWIGCRSAITLQTDCPIVMVAYEHFVLNADQSNKT